MKNFFLRISENLGEKKVKISLFKENEDKTLKYW